MGWILILSNLVPISLLVTLEVVKMAQGMVIAFDEGMRHQATKIPT
jgi:magnesium-transporting ATPase (P-type)